MATLSDWMLEELKDIYDAEHQITEALPKMAQAATDNNLKQAFNQHLETTRKQIERLDKVFDKLGKSPERKTCKAMQGIISEGNELIKQHEKGDTLDAAMIAAAQKVEHYEIASYGSLRTYAKMLGHNDAAKLFQTTLDEEGNTDEKLTDLAMNLNKEAMA
jgi:ferritin-like metal-binding protein YciE